MDKEEITMRIYFFILIGIVLVGCTKEPPEVPFAAAGTDFAEVEYAYPLSTADLAKITPDNLKAASQEQVDQIYARLDAGPIPDGAFEGGAFLPRGESGKSRLSEVVGGGLVGLAASLKTKKVEVLAEVLWKGKVFYQAQRVLRNRIEDLAVIRPLLGAGEIQKINVDSKDAWLLFPAKLYCGQSLLDGRRESVIIDYAFTDEIEGYRENPDILGGRRGFQIRDEIRMVRPGFYLGRTYMGKVFVLNFTLYNEEQAEGGKVVSGEPCWPGEPRRTA
jgi:hypothetical protein